jgi:hypothetical protein
MELQSCGYYAKLAALNILVDYSSFYAHGREIIMPMGRSNSSRMKHFSRPFAEFWNDGTSELRELCQACEPQAQEEDEGTWNMQLVEPETEGEEDEDVLLPDYIRDANIEWTNEWVNGGNDDELNTEVSADCKFETETGSKSSLSSISSDDHANLEKELIALQKREKQ